MQTLQTKTFTGLEDSRALAAHIVQIGMELLGHRAAAARLRLLNPGAGIGLVVDAFAPRMGMLDWLTVTDEDPLLCATLAERRNVSEVRQGRFRELWSADGKLFDLIVMAPRQLSHQLDRPEFHVKHALNRWLAPNGVLVAVVPKGSAIALGHAPSDALHSHAIVAIQKGATA